MIILNLILFFLALVILMKSGDFCASYSVKVAKIFHLSEFLISFVIVAVISTLPEGTIAILSAIENTPGFGLGTLLGSNVADLTLVFGIIVLFSRKGVYARSEIMKKNMFYLLLLIFPVVLGLDGNFSRIDGILLVCIGIFFFFTLSIESHIFGLNREKFKEKAVYKDIAILLISLAILIISANYTIQFGINFANEIGLPAVLISLTFVAIGTCLPELVFSIKAVKANHDGLAIGDILGTVITDATIMLGIMAVIQPFSVEKAVIYVTGFSMVIAALVIISFIETGKMLTKKEGIFLIFFYMIYLFAEFAVNHIIG